MASAFSAAIALPLLVSLQLYSPCEAASAVGHTTWTASQTAVKSPEETCDVDEEDVASFIFAGTELSRSPSAGQVQASAASEATAASRPASDMPEAPPQLSEVSEAIGWEASFQAGVFESKQAIEAEDADVGSWVKDSGNSDAAVPAHMVQAETLLKAGVETAPADRWKEKTAERALRIYYHAKWLAERNYAKAAEHRYRQAAEIARSCRRSVLASHSLARLGYFLVHWRREDEAAVVLQESMKLNTKSNPLAPYLHGVLERKLCSGDVERLKAAEELILTSSEQPSEELEVERSRLMEEIGFWREAEGSTKQCFASSDPAFVLICLFGHAAALLKQVVFT